MADQAAAQTQVTKDAHAARPTSSGKASPTSGPAALGHDHPRGRAPATLPPSLVLALQRSAGNRAVGGLLAGRQLPTVQRYDTAEELRTDLSAHPTRSLEEAYHFLNGRGLLEIVRALNPMSAGVRDRLRSELAGAHGVNQERLRLAFQLNEATRHGRDVLSFYLAHRAEISHLSPAEQSDVVTVLEPSPLRAWMELRGFRALPPAAQVRYRLMGKQRGSQIDLALHNALGDALRTAQAADDPDYPVFFRRVIAGARENLIPNLVTASAHAARRPAGHIAVVGPGPTTRRMGLTVRHDAQEWKMIVPDASGRSPGPAMQQVIPVFLPTRPAPRGRHYPRLHRVADVLALLPPEVRRNIRSLSIEPRVDTTDRGTLARAGAAGDVTYYPQPSPEPPVELGVTLMHETGHVISQRHWGAPPRDGSGRPVALQPGWRRWQSAMAADGFHTSGYAETGLEDDFAETFALYMSSRGSADMDEARQLLPNRFARIDELLRDDAAAHSHPSIRGPAS